MLRFLVVTAFFFAVSASAADDVPAAANAADKGAVVDDAAPVDGAEVVEVARPPAPEPPPIETALPPASSASEMLLPFIKTMLMLGVVLMLVWLTLSKGMGKLVEKAQSGKRVKVLERIALDARRSLFLIDVDGKQIVIGGGDLVRLADLDAASDVKKQERQSIFDKVLKGGVGTVITETQPPATTTTNTTDSTSTKTSEPA